jgi:hypothetical protein
MAERKGDQNNSQGGHIRVAASGLFRFVKDAVSADLGQVGRDHTGRIVNRLTWNDETSEVPEADAASQDVDKERE